MLQFTHGNFRDINYSISRSLFGRSHIERYDLADVAFSGSGHHIVCCQIGARHIQKGLGQKELVSLEKIISSRLFV